jgi:uncharacterized protein YndB with AHSA1/START domain
MWQAWTEPEHFARWAGCDGHSVPLASITMDVRPGGTLRYVMVNDSTGAETPGFAVYREVVEPERLVFVWQDSRLPEESVVTIVFTDLGDTTEMTLHQVGFTYGDLEWGLHASRAGMAEEIDKLARYVQR